MDSDAPIPQEVSFTADQLAWLEHAFPRTYWKPGDTQESVVFSGGQQSVLEHIKARVEAPQR